MTEPSSPSALDDFEQLAAEWARPLELQPASGDWVAARVAVARVCNLCTIGEQAAAAAIARRAVLAIPVAALTWWAGEDPHDYIDRTSYFRENRRKNLHFSRTPDRKSFDEILHFFEALESPDRADATWQFEYGSWATGDFRVRLERDFSDVSLSVTGLQFDTVALEAAFGAGANAELGPIASDSRRRGGRPLSAAWPQWVAELAAYLHEHGFPNGSGSQGQEAVITAIADGLASKGLPCPSRSTVQPIVQAVLNRLRQDGR